MFMVLNSFKQLMRKPGKTLLFFLLIGAASMLLVFGGAMYAQSAGRIAEAEKVLTTVAFIGQKPLSDNEDGIDTDYSEKYIEQKYGDMIEVSDLDFPKADYLVPPSTMPYFLAYNQDLVGALTSHVNESTAWINSIGDPEQREIALHSFLVVAPQRLSMLFSYSENRMRVKYGRLITQSEFDQGAKVCMVSKSFMLRNLVYEGDMIKVPIICANYNSPFPHTLLDSQGQPFTPFFEEEYELVGVYDEGYGARDIGNTNTIIVPKNSIPAEIPPENIVDRLPMKQWTTSCQLQNGGVEQYKAALKEALGDRADQLEISYNDNGYSELLDSMESAKRTAFLLMAVGALASVAIIALLMYFFVIRECRRTAVERSLGQSRQQCRVSILSGLMTVTVLASILGSVAGGLLLDKADVFAQLTPAEEKEEVVAGPVDWGIGGVFDFSSKYSVWPNRRGTQASLAELEDVEPPALVYFLAPAGICVIVAALSLWLVNGNLKVEPILLLSVKI